MATASLGLPGSGIKTIPIGYVQIAALGSGAGGSGLPLSSVSGTATICLITCEGSGIRWRDDGVAPTQSIGFPLNSGDSLLYGGTLTAFLMIPQSGAPTVDISFYRVTPSNFP